jgi:hypothetical protein
MDERVKGWRARPESDGFCFSFRAGLDTIKASPPGDPHMKQRLLILSLALLIACGGESQSGVRSQRDGAGPDTGPDTGPTTPDGDTLEEVTLDAVTDAADAPAAELDGDAPSEICRPCVVNADCAAVGDSAACVSFGAAGAFCGRACDGASDCPGWYDCTTVSDVVGASVQQCVPLNGVCDCTEAFIDAGFATACVVSNDFGTCAGQRVCTAAGLGDCDAPLPAPEACNALDDDCDGDTDEGLAGEPTACGYGACVASGVTACQGGAWVDLCEPGPPGEETCDGVDQDCDGDTDEDLLGETTSCGIGACAATGVMVCVDGAWSEDCTPGDPAAETCNAIDDDCDSGTDEDLEAVVVVCGIGACEASGAGVCVNGAIMEDCTPGAPTDDDASCDGVDDDCDGVADEDYEPNPTSCGIGACAASGALTCVDGASVDTCTPGAPGAEACNALDDDCDGLTDEDDDDLGPLPCDLGAGPGSGSCVDGVCAEPCHEQEDLPDPDFTDTNCDGVDGDVAAAIFVAPAQWGGDDFNPGTPDLPMLTIQAAIAAAASDPDKTMVLISASDYAGPLTMEAGVGVYGGYHKPMGWARGEAYTVTVTVAEPGDDGAQIGVLAAAIPDWTPTPLARLTIHVPANSLPGGSNYGLLAADAQGLHVRDLDLVVGPAGDGVPGVSPGASGQQGTGGLTGGHGCENDNDEGCSSCSKPSGGGGGARACVLGGSAGKGGSGGGPGWGDASYAAGSSGYTGGGPNGQYGTGGAGGAGALDQTGAGGTGWAGAGGQPGDDASGGGAFGGFVGSIYVPADSGTAATATHGAPGHGGGGGGGGGGGERKYTQVLDTDWCESYGGGGGGGGSGGCGGQAGASGTGGGAVFGMLFIDCAPLAERVDVQAASGGAGGDGTPGGGGGVGGYGASGGNALSSNNIPSGKGGKGGQGGIGGRGGHGGGGGGGPSFCAYFHAPTTTPDTAFPNLVDLTCLGAQGGAGGSSQGHPGAAGEAGEVGWCGLDCLAR